jgi:ATP-dependent DNA helicase RecQ
MENNWDLDASLALHFGHLEFREGQRRVIEALLEGRHALAIFPTGAGKSLCYQLPAVLLGGFTIVVSPLIALMKDQVDTLQKRGIAAARLDSTLTAEENTAVFESILSGTLKLLYVAPERFASEAFLARLRKTPPALLAIDEAHCISEWGHNFRPDYLRLASLAKKLRIPRVLALTATATPAVAEQIRKGFGIRKKDCTTTSFHRRNLSIHITPAPNEERLELLGEILKDPSRHPAIVYVTLQRTAENVAAHLKSLGFSARAYHAGMADEVRATAQDDFMQGRCDIIVATIAFGMGIDKADIRSVIHFNLPKTLENYQQEIGRAGRDGLPSHCELLACADDLIVLENFILGDTPDEPSLRRLIDHLLRQGEEFDISRYDLSRTTDIRQLVLETVIAHLEKERILEPTGMFHSRFQISFRHPEERVIAGHTSDRQHFLKSLFDSAKRGRRLLTLDIDQSAASISEPRDRIVKTLRYLEESGDIELKPAGLRHRFSLLPEAKERSPHNIASWLLELFNQREARDLERLESIVAFATSPGCLTKRLLGYFGESLKEPCGHCGPCHGSKPKPLPASPIPEITASTIASIQALRKEGHAALRSKRALTRFLCGMTSPATTRDRLTRHDDFGMLESVPFSKVLEHLEASL